MIKLTSNLFIAKGTERMCFIHPDNPKLCIKVSDVGIKKQHKQELTYLNFLLKKGKLPCDILPKFYGALKTDKGEGLVFERIYNEDETKIESLKTFISKYPQHHQIETELDYLKSSLLKYKIIVRDLNMNNVLVKVSAGNIKLILIDGFGNSDFIPLANYSDWYATRKIHRRWNRFEKSVLKHLNTHKLENLNGSTTQSC